MNVITTQPVDIALRTLGEDNRRNVLAWLDHLKNWENDDCVRDHSHKLNSAENVYVLKTSSDYLIFFRLEQPDIVVLDIATKDTIAKFRHVAGHGRS